MNFDPTITLQEISKTAIRGVFVDLYDKKCSILDSSGTIAAIWLGTEGNHMHLTQDHVKNLLPYLTCFAETGMLTAMTAEKFLAKWHNDESINNTWCNDIYTVFWARSYQMSIDTLLEMSLDLMAIPDSHKVHNSATNLAKHTIKTAQQS